MIRDACADDCLRLSALAFAAKAHCGYDDYERVGARRAGDTPSGSIPGRVLPVYVIDVTSSV